MSNLLDKLDKVETFIFMTFIEKKMKPSKEGYSLTLSGKFLYLILDYPLLLLKHIVWFYTKRIICIIKGCDIVYTIPFNVPEGIYSEECKRCGAYSELDYKSKYEIIYK